MVASLSDSFLKPILLARGVEVPMLVIFLGAIGGYMMSGFIGLFIGAVVLSLGYELATTWIEAESDREEAALNDQVDSNEGGLGLADAEYLEHLSGAAPVAVAGGVAAPEGVKRMLAGLRLRCSCLCSCR